MVDAILTHLLVLSGSLISAIVFLRSTSALRPLCDIGNGDDGVYHLPLLVGIIVPGIEHPTKSAVLRYAFPPQIGQVSAGRRSPWPGAVQHAL
jgi:hypothetical protein